MPNRSPRADGRPLVLGHRGASQDAPENTLAAFRLALAQGADGFELDVWRCGSGELVVVHDADAARTTGVKFRISRTPWSELRRLDAGAWRGDRFAGERLPLLPEVLEELPSAIVNVELKAEGAGDPRLAAAVARLARDPRFAGRLLVSSFDPLLVAVTRALAPRAAAGLLFAADQAWVAHLALARVLRPAALHPERTLAAPSRIAAWKAAGFAVHVWTVDRDDDVVALCAAGVDGVISNRPAAAREAVRRATGR
jgi:glycerophosphoryl diester phosphodiesterase